ncbi:MAG: PspC domain-containing protein [Candidatus Nomurabacteria bacterium]|nr:MAG: PspC domain-containing protein [Candidatus Nomurabacteria bacterium]
MSNSTRLLVRSRTHRMLAGVCGGLGHYFGIDPVIFRIVFLLLTIFDGAGVLIYVVLWLLIPLEGATHAATTLSERAQQVGNEIQEKVDAVQNAGQANQLQNFLGVIVVVFGVVLLSRQLFSFTWLQWHSIWPLTFIFLGIFILMKRS